MSTRKAKGKGKRSAKKSAKKCAKRSPQTPAKKSAGKTKNPVDIVQTRENINNMVGHSAPAIAAKVIENAKTGQLASAKYLFEAVGLYPANEQTAVKPKEDSLAYTLLRRLGLPTESVMRDEDGNPVLESDKRSDNSRSLTPDIEEHNGAEKAETRINGAETTEGWEDTVE